ncbi:MULTISPECIES: ArnT family glycosyltransferase [Halomonas]|uniref:ArnT family glycosyltransferase n=1 Tax=Halomonas TaxID=2745 RepID=UPI001C95ABC6|nr:MULTISPECIES: glycosyltransferase family 39 protein [Halomonas]MBY6209740.1 glycosyltransferase family 39 protein [Halomonas sp. DP3Y7-2]MBY6229959.1 glycosyltransferase family 39 protein [Halomonas sp. DP3Y7-1]MCA0918226.1 glycosyltransferase family 39 protein [Halomonas denitrificans]
MFVVGLPRRPGWGWWLGLVVFAVALLALGLGWRDPWPADEPRFALNAVEMLVTGEFWIPHRGGELYADKPPIFMWASAFFIWLTGSMRIGFMLPSLLAGLGTLGLIVDLCRRLHGPRVGLLAGIATLATLQFVLQAKTAQIDMLLTFFTTLGAYGMLRHALLGPARGWWRAGFVAMGAGILTKGVGFLPLALLPVWGVISWCGRHQGQARVTPLRLRDLVEGLACLLAVVLAWGLPMILITSLSDDPALAAYRDNILFKQTGERYADAWAHLRPWYYYIVQVLPWAWMPLVLTLPWALPNWWRRVKRGDAKVLLPLTAVILIVVFFSLSPGKRGVYMLPTLPLMVMALAPLLPALVRRKGPNRAGFGGLVFFALLLATAGVLGLVGFAPLERLAHRYGVTPWWEWLALGAIALALALALKPRRGMTAITLFFFCLWGWWSTFGYAWMDPERSPRDMMARVSQEVGPNGEVALLNFDEEILLHARSRSVHFGDMTPLEKEVPTAMAWLAEAPEQRWMLVVDKDLEALSCGDLGQAVELGHQNRHDWLLLPGTAFAGCPADRFAAPIYLAPTSVPANGAGRYFGDASR